MKAEENDLLTRTDAGTAMGELMREFWMPALLSKELPAPDAPPARVRLLGEDLVGNEDAVTTETTVRHDALILAEEVGNHPRIDHRYIALEVGDHEIELETPGGSLHAARLDHATETKSLLERRLARGDLRGIKEEHHVGAEGVERQRTGDRHAREDTEHPNHSSLPRRHGEPAASRSAASLRNRRAASLRASRSALRAETTLAMSAITVRRYAGHRKAA